MHIARLVALPTALSLIFLLGACSTRGEVAPSPESEPEATSHALMIEATLDLLSGAIRVGGQGAAGAPCRSPDFQKWVGTIEVTET